MSGQQCGLIEGCAFFNSENRDESVADMLKEQFCISGGADCARLRVAEKVGREYVPEELYPTDHAQAVEIIEAQV